MEAVRPNAPLLEQHSLNHIGEGSRVSLVAVPLCTNLLWPTLGVLTEIRNLVPASINTV